MNFIPSQIASTTAAAIPNTIRSPGSIWVQRKSEKNCFSPAEAFKFFRPRSDRMRSAFQIRSMLVISHFNSKVHARSSIKDKLGAEKKKIEINYFRYGLLIFSSSSSIQQTKQRRGAHIPLVQRKIIRKANEEADKIYAKTSCWVWTHAHTHRVQIEKKRKIRERQRIRVGSQQHQQQSKNVKSFNLFDFPHNVHWLHAMPPFSSAQFTQFHEQRG